LRFCIALTYRQYIECKIQFDSEIGVHSFGFEVAVLGKPVHARPFFLRPDFCDAFDEALADTLAAIGLINIDILHIAYGVDGARGGVEDVVDYAK